MKQLLFILLAFVSLSFVTQNATAQNLPERGEVRRGNRDFERENYESAIESYTKALTYSPSSFEANYNLSNAQHKLQQFDKAEESMAKIAADSLLGDIDRADAYYNLGNSQFHQQKYKEALESYKSSMRLNSADSTTKYNYAITKLLLEAQPQNEDQDQENQEQENEDQEQNQEEQNQEEQDQNQEEQEQEQGDEEQEQQPQDGEISEQELQQILDAIQAQEDKTQEKLDEQEGRVFVMPGGKNW